MRSHQTRMKRYARMIYMLSQCKDAIDNYAALFARITMARIERLGRFYAQFAQIEKNMNIRAALTNQELALAVT